MGSAHARQAFSGAHARDEDPFANATHAKLDEPHTLPREEDRSSMSMVIYKRNYDGGARRLWSFRVEFGNIVLFTGIRLGTDYMSFLGRLRVLGKRPDGVIGPCPNQATYTFQGRLFDRPWERDLSRLTFTMRVGVACRQGDTWHVASAPEPGEWDEVVELPPGTKFLVDAMFLAPLHDIEPKPPGLYCWLHMESDSGTCVTLGETQMVPGSMLADMVVPLE